MATEVLLYTNKFGTFSKTDNHKILARCIDEDFLVEEIHADELFWKSAVADHNPHHTLIDVYQKHIVEFDIYEVHYNNMDELFLKVEQRTYLRARIKRWVNSEDNVFWNKAVPLLREYAAQNPEALVNRTLMRTGPSFIIMRFHNYQSPVSLFEGYLFWALKIGCWTKVIELHLNNGIYFAGLYGNLKVHHTKPKVEFTVGPINLSPRESLLPDGVVEEDVKSKTDSH